MFGGGWPRRHSRTPTRTPGPSTPSPHSVLGSSHFRGGKLRQKEAVTHPRLHRMSQSVATQPVSLRGPLPLPVGLAVVFPLSLTGEPGGHTLDERLRARGAQSQPPSTAPLAPRDPRSPQEAGCSSLRPESFSELGPVWAVGPPVKRHVVAGGQGRRRSSKAKPSGPPGTGEKHSKARGGSPRHPWGTAGCGAQEGGGGTSGGRSPQWEGLHRAPSTAPVPSLSFCSGGSPLSLMCPRPPPSLGEY